MTVAEAVAEWLHEKGIRHAFGIIGAGNLALWEAIERKGATDIICCHHEQAAAMAASFYQRVSGRIAVCLVTTGAGSTNAITGVMAAWMDSTPLIVISGNETAASLMGDTRVKGVQGYRSSDVVAEFVKMSWQLGSTGRDVRWWLDRLHAEAISTRQGPVYLDVPRDVQLQVCQA